jgi:hypothetical protein
MGLYWLTYKRAGRLAGVAIISADTLMGARTRAAVAGLGIGALFEQGHMLDSESAAQVPADCIGRLLSRKEAAHLLEQIEGATGNVR